MAGLVRQGSFISLDVCSGGLECSFEHEDIVVHSMNTERDIKPMTAFCTDSNNVNLFYDREPFSAKKVEGLVKAAADLFRLKFLPFSSYVIYTRDKSMRFVGYINFFTPGKPGAVLFAVILNKEFQNDEMREKIARVLRQNLIPFICSYQDRGEDLRHLYATVKIDNEGACRSLESIGFRPAHLLEISGITRRVYKYIFGEQGRAF